MQYRFQSGQAQHGLFCALCRRRNTVKNAKFCKALLEVIEEANAAAGVPKAKGNLLYTIAGKVRAAGVI